MTLQDNKAPISQTSKRPSQFLSFVSGPAERKYSRRQSIQMTHQKSLRHYLTRERVPTESHYRYLYSIAIRASAVG